MSERILYYTGVDSSRDRLALENSLKLAFANRENKKLKGLLRTALERLDDMLKMDDGQAFSEASKFAERLRTHLDAPAKIDVV